MNIKHLSSILFSAIIVLAPAPVYGEPSPLSEPNFFCQTNGDTLTTSVKSRNGEVLPIFHWKKKALPDKANLQQICALVSQKLENYSASQSDLSDANFHSYNIAGLPAICLSEKNNDCNLVLFTLSPHENPLKAADDVLELILDPKLQGNQIVSNERGLQSTSYPVHFWELVDFKLQRSVEK